VQRSFLTWLLLECLDKFGKESPHTHVEVIESVLGGTPEALLQGRPISRSRECSRRDSWAIH
jgi:hypothetical protein